MPVEPVLRESPPPSALRAIVYGVLVLLLAFLIYQISSGVALVGLLVMQGLGLQELLVVMQSGLVDYPYTTLTANAVGQGVGLAALALAAARLTAPRVRNFLRVQTPGGKQLLVSVLGALCLVPLVQALSDVNRLLPIPDWLARLEESQMALLAAVLDRPGGWVFNVLLLAAVPALCEELLFRGWFQRFVGRAVAVWTAVGLSGVLFALYHLRPTQILPLALLGIYLAYVVWRTDSLVTGIVVHFIYNGLLVLTAPYIEGGTEVDSGPVFPLYVVVLGVAGFVALMFWLHRHGARQVAPVSEAGGAYSAVRSSDPHPHE